MRRFLAVLAAIWMVACADPAPEPYTEHDEPLDFIVEKSAVRGLPGSFDREFIMEDDFFTNANAIDVDDVQAFLEETPYGNRSFLADTRVGNISAAQAIVNGSRAEGINPIVMLARMQVEKSLIGKTRRPSRQSVDFAFGCGCPDNRACNEAYRGFDKQVACAARTLRRHYDGSIAGTSPWVAGVRKRTLDPISVTPDNHATASLYSYTPWVLQGRGGNWLVWNVTLKYVRAFAGVMRDPGAPAPVEPDQPADEAPLQPVEPAPEQPILQARWIGDACNDDRSCRFANGTTGICQRLPSAATGMCTVSCEGLCPDLEGHGVTFCVAASHFGVSDGGFCTRKAASDNRFCEAVPGLESRNTSRFVGRSGASQRDAEVCLPER